MTTLDVTQLANESMSGDAFPASLKADFRVFLDPDVHKAVHAHAAENTKIEICGVIVGEWKRDDNGPFAAITDFIRCDNASSEMTEVTFTHESWAHINTEMDTKYCEKRITGWYHSHPDFGIFLSERDVFIQEHFFSGPGQVALVVDPVRKLEGLFEWRDGKPELMQHYWVGPEIHTIAESKSATASERRAASPANSMHPANCDAALLQTSQQQPTQPLSQTVTTMLSWLCRGFQPTERNGRSYCVA
jgi:proteasome lid subunit RPN8/RPN11